MPSLRVAGVCVLVCAAFTPAVAAAADPTLEPGFPVRAHFSGGTYAAGPATAISVGDIDGDSLPEIVASAVAWGPLYAWNGDGSPVDGWPRGSDTDGAVYPALGELTKRRPGFEIAAGAWNDPLLAWEDTGAMLAGWPRPAGNYVQTPPTLADVDGDGIDEIFINESFGDIEAYRADGTRLPGWPPPFTSPSSGEEVTPAIADIDGDGAKDVVTVAGSNYEAFVFARRANGANLPGFPLRIGDKGMVRMSPAIGDVDGDGQPEIVAPYIAAGPAPALAVVSATGVVERRLVGAARVGNPGPTAVVLADLDGDHVPEILIQSDAITYAWSGKDGSAVPGWPKSGGDEWSEQSPVVGDVDGDQKPDVVVVTTRAGEAQGGILRAYNAAGELLPGFPKEPEFGSGHLTPAIADIDGDGRNEIIVAGFEGPYSGEWPYIWAFDLGGGPHGAIEWGQFGGGPRHDGRYGQPTTPPPPPAPAETPTGAAGPATRVTDLRPGVAGSRPSQPAVLGNALLFRADAGSAGDELYVTDGTAAGTRLVRDIWPGATGSKPTELVTAGKRVFFSAATASAGRELWVSDGTAAGTKLVKDIWPGAAGSDPHHVTAVGDAVFFSAWDGSHGFELWRSDGTDVGTKMVADSLVATSEPTGAASGGAPTLLTPFDGGLSYAVGYVDQNQNSGRFAMRTDAGGGPPWTFGYRTLDPGLSPHHPGDIAAAGPTLFMHDGTLLMRSDGTTENWTAFYDNEVNLAGPFAITGDAALFAAAADDGLGRELWRLGTNGVPRRVADIAPGSDSSAPQDITPWGGGAAFGARTSDVGTELWRTDGTSVMRVADIRPGPAGSDPGRLTAVGSDLVFTADDGQHGDELWRTTGTAEGTHMLADVAPGARSSAITWIRRVGNRLVFDADDGASGSELWSIALPLPEPPAPPPPSDGGGTSSPPASSSEPALLGASSQPPQTPPAAVETLPARTPAGPAADRVAPRLSRLTLMRRRGRAYLSFRLSEPARVKVIAQRRVRGHWRTLRFDFSRRGARGRNRIGITPLVRAARRPARLMVSATDSAGNRSRVLVVRVS